MTGVHKAQGPEGTGAGDKGGSAECCRQNTLLATLIRGAASLAEAVLRPCIAAPGDTFPAHSSCMHESHLGNAYCVSTTALSLHKLTALLLCCHETLLLLLLRPAITLLTQWYVYIHCMQFDTFFTMLLDAFEKCYFEKCYFKGLRMYAVASRLFLQGLTFQAQAYPFNEPTCLLSFFVFFFF